jgi:hypothetical protein
MTLPLRCDITKAVGKWGEKWNLQWLGLELNPPPVLYSIQASLTKQQKTPTPWETTESVWNECISLHKLSRAGVWDALLRGDIHQESQAHANHSDRRRFISKATRSDCRPSARKYVESQDLHCSLTPPHLIIYRSSMICPTPRLVLTGRSIASS